MMPSEMPQHREQQDSCGWPHDKVGSPAKIDEQASSPQPARTLKPHSPHHSTGESAFSSPVSSCSASTRLPDSDSEEFFLLERKHSGSRSSSFSEVSNGDVTEPQSSLIAPPRLRLRPAGVCDALQTDLAWFRRCMEVDVTPWAEGDFATVGRLAKSLHGEVRYLTDKAGTGVVAKVMPTAKVNESRSTARSNERLLWFSEEEVSSVEDPCNEIAVLTYLQRSAAQCENLLKLLGVFQDASWTYLITEYCDGGELFELIAYGDVLSAKEVQRYVSQLFRAVRHLHDHNVAHRDISLENVLLRRGDCVLMDFGQAVRIRSMDGVELRYFAEAGKRMYRSPEMYVPREKSVQVVCPSDASPGTVVQVSYDRCRCEVLLPHDAIPGMPCRVEPYGYAAAPADIFACGVCSFVLALGKPPWSIARDSDPTFSFIRRHGVPALLRQWRAGLELVPAHEEDELLAAMLRINPKDRLTIEECQRNAWLCGTISGDPGAKKEIGS